MQRLSVESFCDLAEDVGLSQLWAENDRVELTVADEVVCVAEPFNRPAQALIRSCTPRDEAAVIALWQACGLTRPWNNPRRDIARKLAENADSFFVAEANGQVVGTVMVGYDGHRGWVYYLAVAAGQRSSGLGRALMTHAENWLVARGCAKLNLLVRSSNREVLDFYRKLGYTQDDVVSLGKRLIDDAPVAPPKDAAR